MRSDYHLEHGTEGYWLTCARWGDASPIGPYKTQREAFEDARGVERTLRDLDSGRAVQRPILDDLGAQVSNQDAERRIESEIRQRRAQRGPRRSKSKFGSCS